MYSSLRPHGLYSPWYSPGQNTGVGSCSLLQGIFPTQGLNPGLPHCKQILYQLTYHRKLTNLITGTTAFSNSMKLWAMPCRTTQDGRDVVESSDKIWSTGQGNANHFTILAFRTSWTVWKGKKIGHWKMNSPGRQVPNMATGDQWRNQKEWKIHVYVPGKNWHI